MGATATAICTGYFSVRYHVQGEFDSAYPRHRPAGMAAHHPMTGGGMMGGGMMGRPGPAPGAEAEPPAQEGAERRGDTP